MKRTKRQIIALLGILLAYGAFFCLINCKDSLPYSIGFIICSGSSFCCILIAANQTKS